MSNHHALTSDFPEHFNKIRELHLADPDFRQQNERYHALDREIHSLSSRGVPTDDHTFLELKKQRAKLKDLLYHRLIQR